MSQVILNILCEGHTEDKFARTTIQKHLSSHRIVTKTQLLLTSKKECAYGGMLGYGQAKRDIHLWMKQNMRYSGYEHHFYTTMFDLYRLPGDFPGYQPSIRQENCYGAVASIEEAFRKAINAPNFIPYIQLHEFEALVFAKLEELHSDYPDKKKSIEGLIGVLDEFDDNPELINTSIETAPSKRLAKALGNYNKMKSGPMVAEKAGIHFLKDKCRHFREWIETLENLNN